MAVRSSLQQALSQKKVTAFLNARGGTIVKQTPHGEYIRVVAPVGVWNEMLDAEFAVHNHATTGQQILRTTSSHLFFHKKRGQVWTMG